MDPDYEALREIDERERVEKRVMESLLDSFRQKAGHVLSVRADMGSSASFITAVSMKWLANNVGFAKSLPMWEGKLDEAGQIIIDEDTLEELRQREPDWKRQIPMVHYLACREHHKFPTLLIAAWQEWAGNPDNDAWLDGQARRNSITETSLDSVGTYIDLNCSETRFFALDGQHRLMAIKGIVELVEKEHLVARNSNGKPLAKGGISLDDIANQITSSTKDARTPRAKLQSLLNEKVGIEIIPSVMKNETYKKALRRLRSIFVHVNKSAKRLTKGELALLDEDNGFAVVARRIMVRHAMLTGGRVHTKNSQLGENSFEYTTLECLVEIARQYLGQKTCASWVSKSEDGLPIRPEEEEIDLATKTLENYFDNLITLPSHNDLVQDKNKSCKFYREEGPNENILFRPIAQMALAEALGQLERDHDLSDIMQLLAAHEKKGELKLRDKKSLWYGVLCDPANNEKMRKDKKSQGLCAKLLRHLLGSGTPKENREGLLKEFREARKFGDKYLDLHGTPVDSDEKVSLPRPWR